MDEVEDSPAGSSAAAWRKQLDHRLITGQSACVFLLIITEQCYLQPLYSCCVFRGGCRACWLYGVGGSGLQVPGQE